MGNFADQNATTAYVFDYISNIGSFAAGCKGTRADKGAKVGRSFT